MTNNLFHNCAGIMVCFDLTNRKTFEKVDQIPLVDRKMDYWLDLVSEKCRESPSIYIIGTKLDEVDSDPSKRSVAQQEAFNFASSRNLEYFEVSALTSQNVGSTFKKVG